MEVASDGDCNEPKASSLLHSWINHKSYVHSLWPQKDLICHYNCWSLIILWDRWIAENSNVEYNYQLLGIQMMVIGKKNDEEVLPGGRIITPSNYRPLSSTQACVITNPTLHCTACLYLILQCLICGSWLICIHCIGAHWTQPGPSYQVRFTKAFPMVKSQCYVHFPFKEGFSVSQL